MKRQIKKVQIPTNNPKNHGPSGSRDMKVKIKYVVTPIIAEKISGFKTLGFLTGFLFCSETACSVVSMIFTFKKYITFQANYTINQLKLKYYD
jgi:hypothetical protein